jgi:probable HAF family extracellular repeat protein
MISKAQTSFLSYHLYDLGVLGSRQSIAYGINNKGEVVGFATISDGREQAFLYSGGTIQLLSPFAAGYSGAFDINSSGIIVGYAQMTVPDGILGNRAIEYTVDQAAYLGAGRPSGSYSINSQGQVVGYDQDGHAFLFLNGTRQILNGLRNFSDAIDINNQGQIAGYDFDSIATRHAFLYSSGVTADLGTLFGGYSQAYSLNDSAQVVGDSDGHGFLYKNGVMTDLGPGLAKAINNEGVIVGETANHTAAILSGGHLTDLNTLIDQELRWTLKQANGINDQGEIVGWGYDPSGNPSAFLLSPEIHPGSVTINVVPDHTPEGNPNNADGIFIPLIHGHDPHNVPENFPSWVLAGTMFFLFFMQRVNRTNVK